LHFTVLASLSWLSIQQHPSAFPKDDKHLSMSLCVFYSILQMSNITDALKRYIYEQVTFIWFEFIFTNININGYNYD
uniref:Uncharacterized protein n=1 Tax=Paramormyrops kingsleyae TaxID=1676925 RepID=A0A3B3R5F8_9TELE